MVLSAARLCRYPAKSAIYRQADPPEHVLLLREGRARYFYETRAGKKLILRWLLPGDTFGWAGILPQMREYLVGVEAVKDSVLSVWDTHIFRGLARRLPQLVENALFITSYSFAWYIAAHAALCSQTAQERLSNVLFEYATKVGRKVAEGIEVDATNQELADAANVTHFTTSRLITAWERTGLLQKQRGKIMVCCPERLFQHAKKTDLGTKNCPRGSGQSDSQLTRTGDSAPKEARRFPMANTNRIHLIRSPQAPHKPQPLDAKPSK